MFNISNLKERDTPRHQGQRKRLVDALAQRGDIDLAVLQAIGRVPRHLFLDSAFERQAYDDQAFSIGAGQTISQPSTVAVQSTLLEVKRGMKVLEVGTGSGYQAAVLAELGCKVFSIERQRELFTRTKALLPAMGYAIKTFYGDGYAGIPVFAPFERVIVTAGAPFIPEALVNQLMPGGIMVIPVDSENGQVMHTLRKLAEGEIETTTHGQFKFVPLLGEKAG